MIQRKKLYIGEVKYILFQFLDEIECHIIKFDHPNKRVRIQPNLRNIFDKLQNE